MKLLTFVFGFLLCILIVLPAEGNFLDKLKGVGEKIGNVGEKIGRGFASVGKKIGLGIVKLGKPLANPLCKLATGLLCKGVAVGGSALFEAATEGAGAAVGDIIQTGLYAGCTIVRKKVDACDKIPTKREVYDDEFESDEWTWFPISDDFGEYDDNNDGVIEYEEFAFEFLARFRLFVPHQLMLIFNEADINDDGVLDGEEFYSAPWDFGRYPVKVQKTPVMSLW